jgi:hypothetical protein
MQSDAVQTENKLLECRVILLGALAPFLCRSASKPVGMSASASMPRWDTALRETHRKEREPEGSLE